MTSSKIGLAVAALAVLLAAGSARAFTYDSRTNQNPDGSARFTDPESALGKSSDDSKSGFSVHFSGSGTNGQANGVDSRFLPSANNAFNSPGTAPNNLDLALGNRRW